jgi:hypothetical protein
VKSDSSAPTANNESAVTPIAIGSVRGPDSTMNGASGRTRRRRTTGTDAIAAPHGEPSSSGLRPSSSRAERVERMLGIGDDPRSELDASSAAVLSRRR